MKILKIIGIVVGLAAAIMVGLVIMNPNNIAETSVDAKEEALRPRKYKTDLPTFIGETEKIIANQTTYLKSWKLISSSSAGATASLKIEVPVVIFIDDLEIKAEVQNEEVLVNVHSNSRVGKSDLGENRRHILQILEALDKKFAK